jgi:6-phosphogluconolactonase
MTALAVRRFASRTALESALAERLTRALAAPGPEAPALMLSGGTTPLPVYRTLAARAGLAHGEHLRLLYSDERYVPADYPESNYLRSRPLLDALSLPAGAVLRVRTELPLEEAADDYQRQLEELLQSGRTIGLGLLGLGADGHTASLFAGTDLTRARGRLALAVHRPDGLSAVSVTPELLARVAAPLFVVAGDDKRAAVRSFLAEDPALIAWRAVEGCASVELWFCEGS